MTPGIDGPFVIPGYRALSGLRDALAQVRVPAPVLRSAADWAHVAVFTTVTELLRFQNEFKRRVASGERCRLVEVKHRFDEARFCIEFVIEPVPAELL